MGGYFFFRDREIYVALAFWFWFLTPAMRRIIDFQVRWSDVNLIMLAPYLFTSFSAIELRRIPVLFTRTYAPYLLILMSVIYGYLVGIVMAGLSVATYGLLTWFVPVAFGFYFAVNPDSFEANRRVVTRAFLWGALVMGIYGVHQFFFLLPLGQVLVIMVRMDSQGLPEPEHVRVFSTMNSSGPFATVLMAALLVVLTSRGAHSLARGYCRSCCVRTVLSSSGLAGVGSGSNFPAAPIAGSVVEAPVAGDLLWRTFLDCRCVSSGPVGHVLEERLETFTSLEEDYSYQNSGKFLPRVHASLANQRPRSGNRHHWPSPKLKRRRRHERVHVLL